MPVVRSSFPVTLNAFPIEIWTLGLGISLGFGIWTLGFVARVAPTEGTGQNPNQPMSFPLGKTILALVAVAILSGGAVLFHRPPAPADLTLWTFADPHARMYTGTYLANSASSGPSLLEQFEND